MVHIEHPRAGTARLLLAVGLAMLMGLLVIAPAASAKPGNGRGHGNGRGWGGDGPPAWGVRAKMQERYAPRVVYRERYQPVYRERYYRPVYRERYVYRDDGYRTRYVPRYAYYPRYGGSHFSFAITLGRPLPAGYCYYDPYCDERFDSWSDYRYHLRSCDHPWRVEAISVSMGYPVAAWEYDDGGWDRCGY